MIRRPPRSTLFPTRRSSDLGEQPQPVAQVRDHRRRVRRLARLDRGGDGLRSEEHTSELQSRRDLVCRLLLEKKKKTILSTSSFCFPHSIISFSFILYSYLTS